MHDEAADLLSEVRGFIDDVNSGKAEAALRRLTEDVCIVEDIAPFRWAGPEAGAQWLAAMGANARRLGVTSIAMTTAEPRRIEIEDDHGYCIVPGVLTLAGPEASFRVDGLITFALRLGGGRWRISALTWTGDRPAVAQPH